MYPRSQASRSPSYGDLGDQEPEVERHACPRRLSAAGPPRRFEAPGESEAGMWVFMVMAGAAVVFWREVIKLAVIGVIVLTTLGAVEVLRAVH